MMKDWLSIGEFAELVGVSTRTLRVYEEASLIASHARGDNGYRYYRREQAVAMKRILELKQLGFSLSEIRTLLVADDSMTTERLRKHLLRRRDAVNSEKAVLGRQAEQIDLILSSLQTQTALNAPERRYVMSQFEKIAIVVTGTNDLEQTASLIQKQLRAAQVIVPVLRWNDRPSSFERPYILVIPENALSENDIATVQPDVVLVKNVSRAGDEIAVNYLRLYSAAGPQMTTVFNADDQLSVKLASSKEIRKGRIFCFSKNAGVEDQIRRIGGVVSDGERLTVYNFNLVKSELKIPLERALAFDEEVALIASIGAVLDIGLERLRA